MNVYENIVILNASLSDEELEAATGKIRDLITNSGGEILKTEVWGRRKLAYEIKRHKKGFYVLFLFKSAPAFVKKLEGFYKVTDTVIRYMVVRPDKKALKNLVPGKVEESAAPRAEAAAAEPTGGRSGG